jgi:multidrug resistance efflux pump
MREVTTPPWIANGASWLSRGFLAMLLLLTLLPWQQSAPGTGRVVAYVPAARQQYVSAPIKGRVVNWFVREGQHVAEGDPLVELADNDPEYTRRLQDKLDAITLQRTAADAKVDAGQVKVEAQRGALQAAIDAGEAKVRSSKEKVRALEQDVAGAQAAYDTASIQLDRAQQLFDVGIRSRQELENATLKRDSADAKLASIVAKLRGARQDLTAAQGELDKARTESEAKLAEARGDLETSRGVVADYAQKALEAETSLARQSTRIVAAPSAGFVTRVLLGQGAEQVKEGDNLALIVPDTDSRAVELYLDGNDLALVRPGDPVRLQFEGWPALQFSGWPSVAIGSFGGRLDFIDATDDGSGQFRVMVLADPDEPAWPDPWLLRQGLPAKGWVMLSTVPLGYEMWRQLNDFPPTIANERMPKAKGSSGGKDVGDPVKRPKKAEKALGGK